MVGMISQLSALRWYHSKLTEINHRKIQKLLTGQNIAGAHWIGKGQVRHLGKKTIVLERLTMNSYYIQKKVLVCYNLILKDISSKAM